MSRGPRLIAARQFARALYGGGDTEQIMWDHLTPEQQAMAFKMADVAAALYGPLEAPPAGGWVPDRRTLETLASGLRKFAPELCDALVAKHAGIEQAFTDLLAVLRRTDG